jgi:hypothetical protein
MLRAAGESGQARAAHDTALDIARRIGNRYEEARSLEGLADLLEATGRCGPARQQFDKALQIYAELGVEEAKRLQERLRHRPAPR